MITSLVIFRKSAINIIYQRFGDAVVNMFYTLFPIKSAIDLIEIRCCKTSYNTRLYNKNYKVKLMASFFTGT